jgi:opacity protein-like surface antigen
MLRYTLGRKKLNGFINTGVQLDIALSRDNAGWLVIGESNSGTSVEEVSVGNLNYNTIQPGITAGAGMNYNMNKNTSLNCEFRFTANNHVYEGMTGNEKQYLFKAGITYKIFKREK